MSHILALDVESRLKSNKSSVRELRKQQKIPAIIYGGKGDAIPISVSLNSFNRIYRQGRFLSRLLSLSLEDKTIQVLPKDIQRHPVTDIPEHLDFQRIEDHMLVKVWVNVEFLNAEASPGLRRGGVLNIVRRKIELWCKAGTIPEKLYADLAGLQIGDTVHFSAIKVPEDAQATIEDRDFTVATIAGRMAKEEIQETEGEEEGEEDSKETQDEEEPKNNAS